MSARGYTPDSARFDRAQGFREQNGNKLLPKPTATRSGPRSTPRLIAELADARSTAQVIGGRVERLK
jgi:hypothetical protein